jgi:hypothetical protein
MPALEVERHVDQADHHRHLDEGADDGGGRSVSLQPGPGL